MAIGFVNTAVYLSIYAALNPWIPYLMARVLGCAVSIVGSFLLNSCITCRTRPTWRGFLRYPVSSVFNPVASGALLYVVVSRFEMGKNVAALVAGVIVTPVSFLLARWAYNSGRPTTNATGIDPNAPAEAKRDTTTLGQHQLAGR
ncbi:GtrA family protein [Streptomyces anulatus]|uniref:GtrA family protein n=1 Tax=Streptomyces anulatus TaxID=1892 RepID=UPI0038155E60